MNPPAVLSRSPFSSTHRRLSAYLRLCGLPAPHAARLGRRLLEETPGDSGPSALARALARVDAWTAAIVPTVAGESPGHRAARGRARLFLSGLPRRWPDAFLAPMPPPDAQQALIGSAPELTPPLRQMTMTPQPLDLGPVSAMADQTWRTFDKWPFLRGLSIWLLFAALLGGAFFLVRF